MGRRLSIPPLSIPTHDTFSRRAREVLFPTAAFHIAHSSFPARLGLVLLPTIPRRLPLPRSLVPLSLRSLPSRSRLGFPSSLSLAARACPRPCYLSTMIMGSSPPECKKSAES